MVAGLFAIVAGGLAGGVVYREITGSLPPVDKLLRYQLPVATRVYADDGTLIGEFFTEKRYLAPIARVPTVVRHAFIAAEDASFYKHRGVDVFGIARAALANLTAGSVVQGGSTITQQVVKALLLTPERSYERKAKEILLALRLERQLSKDEILYLYLNLIYLGGGAYGIGAAAQEYFDKDVSELGLAEAALLAGLPQAPSRYSPFRHWERAKHRQRYVLERMAQERFITWDQAEAALAEPIELARGEESQPARYVAAPHFVEHVRRLLEDRYGGTAPYQAGLNVFTTVNLPMQRAAEAALRTHLEEIDQGRTQARPLRRLSDAEARRFLASARAAKPTSDPVPGRSYRALVLTAAASGGFTIQVNRLEGRLIATPERPLPTLAPHDLIAVRRQPGSAEPPIFVIDADPQLEGAVVSIDLPSGAVKAMVGGYDFERSQFNRATQARRQPGSSFKPFIYAAALDRGYTPASVIVDAPIVLASSGSRSWTPRNYDEKFNGPTTLRDALTFSRNVVTVKLAQNIGINYLVDYLPRFGFERAFAKNLSIALGSQEVTLLELTRAYTPFADRGRLITPRFFTKITDPHGRVLEEFAAESEPVISPETAYIVTSMLESVVQRGTGRHVRALGRPTAGKTGTTNDMHDAWFIGYTPDVVTGVWVGYDSERSLGKKQSGGRVAAPIFLSYMQKALGDAPVSDFAIPDGITFVSVERGSGRPASSYSDSAFLECFKKGSEPTYRGDEYYDEDDLQRAVGRMTRGSRYWSDRESDDPEAHDPWDWHDEGFDRDPRFDDWDAGVADPFADDSVARERDDDGYRRNEGRRGWGEPYGRRIDDRPAPRAEDYLAPRPRRDDREAYRRPRPRDERDDPRLRRRDDAAYRPEMRDRGRRILEEPLPY